MLSNNIGQGTKARAVFLGNWSSKLSGCLPNSSPALSLLLLAHPKGMTGRAAGMRASQGIQRLRGLPEPCPFEEPYFLLEASYVLQKYLEYLQEARERIGLQIKKDRARKSSSRGTEGFDITMETSAWQGAWGSRGGLLNTGGVEPCAHVGEPSSETPHTLC